MSTKPPQNGAMDFTAASERAMQLRSKYQQLETLYHKDVWTTEEDMLAFTTDVGALGRLVMAAEGRWIQDGDVQADLGSKMGECLWWLLVLSARLEVDITEAFTSFIDKRNADLA
ncbi:MAG: hypothetical protein P4N59_18370 [Negativicutes bacterium]|nr:hypothetical protein [Negativicutes bacterium]